MSQALPTAILGRTGIEVTRLGFGTALWRPDRHHWTEQAASALYNEVLDCGHQLHRREPFPDPGTRSRSRTSPGLMTRTGAGSGTRDANKLSRLNPPVSVIDTLLWPR